MQVNTKSLEDIVKKYLALAEERTEAARQQSQQTADDVDDLDVLQTPERWSAVPLSLHPLKLHPGFTKIACRS